MLVALTKGRNAEIDDADYALVVGYAWHYVYLNGPEYAQAKVDGRTVYMHRLIMGDPLGMEVDHRNGNGLDNRRANLRVATHQQNLVNQGLSTANTSGYKGVSWDKRCGRWVAQTKLRGKHLFFGYHATAEEAARAYDCKMRELHGSFARMNFPE